MWPEIKGFQATWKPVGIIPTRLRNLSLVSRSANFDQFSVHLGPIFCVFLPVLSGLRAVVLILTSCFVLTQPGYWSVWATWSNEDCLWNLSCGLWVRIFLTSRNALLQAMVPSGLQVGVNEILTSSTYIVAQATWKFKFVAEDWTCKK